MNKLFCLFLFCAAGSAYCMEKASDRIQKAYNPRYQEWLKIYKQQHSAERLSFFISAFLFIDLHKLKHEKSIDKSVDELVKQIALNSSRTPFNPSSTSFEKNVITPLNKTALDLGRINEKISQLIDLKEEMDEEILKKSKL